MSGISDRHLVRVASLDELRPGLVVVVKDCDWHDGPPRPCAMTLLKPKGPIDFCYGADGGGQCHEPLPSWFTSHDDSETWTCFCDCIATGTLYRLRDLDDAEEEGRRIACDIDDKRRVEVRERVGFPLAGRAR